MADSVRKLVISRSQVHPRLRIKILSKEIEFAIFYFLFAREEERRGSHTPLMQPSTFPSLSVVEFHMQASHVENS